MTNEQFDDLVHKLEEQARRKPSAYRLKVYLLALLGNVYVGSILLILLALLAALFVSLVKFQSGIWGGKGIGIVGAFLYLVGRPLWVRIEPPAGIEITAGQAPELFATINELRSKLGRIRFDHVLITEEPNAAIAQLPRLGIFGWHRNYLIIGIPLMKSLTCEQFKAVLAHEFGHLAKGHGRESHSIYRQRLRWNRLMTVLEVSASKGRFLLMPFLNWFVPYFGAFSFPLARANEYEADAISVRLTSSRATAEALTSIEVVAGYLTDFYWPRINAEFGEQAQPSREPYSEMSDALATRLDKLTCGIWIGPAMASQAASEDTHPALSERLAAIGEEPIFSPPELGHAADQLLGPSLERITKAVDSRWKDNILSKWEERHEEIQEGRRRLTELNQKHANGIRLNVQERRERAELTEAIAKNANAALDQLRALHETVPDDASICLALGSRLLMRDDNTGCAVVERALQSDENAILQGCELLRDYYWRNGHEKEASAWNSLLIDEAQIQWDASKERNALSPTDEFEPHVLAEDVLAALVTQLRAIPNLSAAYLIKKRVLLENRPLYVLGYRVSARFSLRNKQKATEVFEEIQNSVRFPGDTFIVNIDGQNYRVKRKFSRMQWAKIIGPGSSIVRRVLRLLMALCEKIVALVVILFGIWVLLWALNDIFGFTSPFFPDEQPEIGLSICRVIFSIILIIFGTRRLINPID